MKRKLTPRRAWRGRADEASSGATRREGGGHRAFQASQTSCTSTNEPAGALPESQCANRQVHAKEAEALTYLEALCLYGALLSPPDLPVPRSSEERGSQGHGMSPGPASGRSSSTQRRWLLRRQTHVRTAHRLPALPVPSCSSLSWRPGRLLEHAEIVPSEAPCKQAQIFQFLSGQKNFSGCKNQIGSIRDPAVGKPQFHASWASQQPTGTKKPQKMGPKLPLSHSFFGARSHQDMRCLRTTCYLQTAGRERHNHLSVSHNHP